MKILCVQTRVTVILVMTARTQTITNYTKVKKKEMTETS